MSVTIVMDRSINAVVSLASNIVVRVLLKSAIMPLPNKGNLYKANGGYCTYRLADLGLYSVMRGCWVGLQRSERGLYTSGEMRTL